eukprot:g5061.t1
MGNQPSGLGGHAADFSLRPVPQDCAPAVGTSLPRHLHDANAEAVALLEDGRHLEAIKRLRAALNVCPDAPVLESNLALCLAQRNEFADAKAMYQRALQHTDRNEGDAEGGEHAAPAPPDLANRLGLAWCDARLGRGNEAIELYQELYQDFPEKHDILFQMAESVFFCKRAFCDVGETDNAIETLKFFLQQCPKHFKAHRLLAECYEKSKNTELALRTYEYVLKQFETSAPAVRAAAGGGFERETRLRFVAVLRDLVEQQRAEENPNSRFPTATSVVGKLRRGQPSGIKTGRRRKSKKSTDRRRSGRCAASSSDGDEEDDENYTSEVNSNEVDGSSEDGISASSQRRRRSSQGGGAKTRTSSEFGGNFRSSLLQRCSAIAEERPSDLDESSLLEEEIEEREILTIHEYTALQQLQKLVEKDPADVEVLRELCFASKKIPQIAKYGSAAYELRPCPELGFHVAETYSEAVQNNADFSSGRSGAPPQVACAVRSAMDWYRKTLEAATEPHLPAMLALARLLINCDENVVASPVLDAEHNRATLNPNSLLPGAAVERVDSQPRPSARPSYLRKLNPGGGDDFEVPEAESVASRASSSRTLNKSPSSCKPPSRPPSEARMVAATAIKHRYLEATEILAAARRLDFENEYTSEILQLTCVCKLLTGNLFAARSLAGELRANDGPFCRTALFVLAEIQEKKRGNSSKMPVKMMKTRRSKLSSDPENSWWRSLVLGGGNSSTKSSLLGGGGPLAQGRESLQQSRQSERLLLAIAEAYKERKRFESASNWVTKALQCHPSSTKLQCFKMQLELDRKTHNNLLDHSFSDHGLFSSEAGVGLFGLEDDLQRSEGNSSSANSSSCQTRDLERAELNSSRQTTVIGGAVVGQAGTMGSPGVVAGSLVRGGRTPLAAIDTNSPAKVDLVNAGGGMTARKSCEKKMLPVEDSPKKQAKRKNAALRRRSHHCENENLFEDVLQRRSKRESAKMSLLRNSAQDCSSVAAAGGERQSKGNQKLEPLGFPSITEEQGIMGNGKSGFPENRETFTTDELVNTIALHESDLWRSGDNLSPQTDDRDSRPHRQKHPSPNTYKHPDVSAAESALLSDDVFFVRDVGVKLLKTPDTIIPAVDLETVLRVWSHCLGLCKEKGAAVSDATWTRLQVDARLHLCDVLLRMYDYLLEGFVELSASENENLLKYDDDDEDALLLYGESAAAKAKEQRDSRIKNAEGRRGLLLKQANEHFRNAVRQLRDAERRMRNSLNFDREKFLQVRAKHQTALLPASRKNSYSSVGGTKEGGYSDEFAQDPEGFLARKFFSCAAHVVHRRSVEAPLLQGGSGRGSLKVLAAELAFFLGHEKALAWIQKAGAAAGAAAGAEKEQLVVPYGDPGCFAPPPRRGEQGPPELHDGAMILKERGLGGPGGCPQALYRPKLLLGRHYANLGNHNQALHHFKIAAKHCPEN